MKTKWKTKDGCVVSVKDMGDSHLLNTVKMLQRCAMRKKLATEIFYVSCVPPTADGALDCFNHEFDDALDSTWIDYTPPIYESMVKEIEKRKLVLKNELERRYGE